MIRRTPIVLVVACAIACADPALVPGDDLTVLRDATVIVGAGTALLPHMAVVLQRRPNPIEEGMRADLLVLKADPLTDIRHTRSIERIYVRGVGYTPGSLLSR